MPYIKSERSKDNMKIVKQDLNIIGGLSPIEHIEKIGRICYKSEDKIADGTASKFISMLYNNGHHAMLEHYRFIMEVSPIIYGCISSVKHDYIQMTNSEYNGRQRFVISFSARGISNIVENSNCQDYGVLPMTLAGIRDELIGHIVKAYGCYELFGWDVNRTIMLSTGIEFIPNTPNAMSRSEWEHHGWKSVHFITDRGISHEIVRHRLCSFAQESTRYCNYGIDKFGKEITVIDQGFSGYDNNCWREAVACAESMYFELLSTGVKPQMARSVLPTCLKTEIVVTANIEEWNHIMNLRYYGTTGTPHPMIKKLVEPLEGVFNYD